MRVRVVGLGLIGGSIALGLRGRHDVAGYDRDDAARAAARGRGIVVVDALDAVLPADAVVVATPLAAVVPTLRALAPRAAGAVLVEVGSLKADVALFAESAPEGVRIVGLHPMAGSTASGIAAADPALLRGRPFLAVATARSDERSMALAGELARDLGGSVTVCSPAVHDRAIAAVSALPLASAIALDAVARAALPMPFEAVAGTGIRDATRLAATPPELALPLLGAPGLPEHIAALRERLGEIERALGDERALRRLLAERAERA
ncbi:MAG: prephenate dehydrogenase/arogenate dehydrogenase family protein [Chloroflexota bacterium]|nr:prephenate dehydrogenase/arogenate dehydrogenase family protein [Chloroflexota bacterium]MDE3100932.1 prephenate dehydrogenase/arogenate dehydrogenase family protein [Chloroflexota bacterium]